MLVDNTDSEIIAEIIKGRKERFAVLIQRYQQAAFKMALVILRHPADAEDAVSEAFVKAMRPSRAAGTTLILRVGC